MTITFNGTDIEATDSGFPVNIEDWSASLARHLAAAESIELGAIGT